MRGHVPPRAPSAEASGPPRLSAPGAELPGAPHAAASARLPAHSRARGLPGDRLRRDNLLPLSPPPEGRAALLICFSPFPAALSDALSTRGVVGSSVVLSDTPNNPCAQGPDNAEEKYSKARALGALQRQVTGSLESPPGGTAGEPSLRVCGSRRPRRWQPRLRVSAVWSGRPRRGRDTRRPPRGWWGESLRPSGGALRLLGNSTEVLCRCCYCVACAILVTQCCLQRHLIAASAAASGSAAQSGPLPHGSRGTPAPSAEDPCKG